MFTLSQIVGRAWGFGEIAVEIIIALAIAGIMFVATKAMGSPIPQWLLTIVGIVVVACVAIVAIRFLFGM